jgi:hypothetical protein
MFRKMVINAPLGAARLRAAFLGALFLWTLFSLLLGACTTITPQPTPEPTATSVLLEPPLGETATVEATPSATPTLESTATTEAMAPVIYGPHNFPANISPISGEAIQDPSLLERRPVAVKVQLFPRGQRPPWGVSLADIVYDYYQNFGITRLHAIFYGENAETVGPIRSARLLDQSLVQMYESIFAFGSAEQRTYSRLFGSDVGSRLILEGHANCPPLCRVDPNGPNELVTNTAELSKYASEQGVDNIRQNLDGMYFQQETPPTGQPGSQAFVRYSISSYNLWDFNPEIGRYMRYQDTQEAQDTSLENVEALLDKLTNQQISADNVVIVIVPHKYAFGTHPGVNEVVDINLAGSGPGYAFRDGQVFQVVWNRPNKNSVLFLTFQDGSFYPFKPGNTWFEVVGASTNVGTPNPGVWRFDHKMP